MGEPIVITVPWDPQRLSPNQRMHWSTRADLARKAKIAAVLGWARAGKPVIEGPVDVSLLVRRGRSIDPDNALAGCKSVLDALCNRRRSGEGVVEDDDATRVRYAPVQFEIGKQWRGREEIVVTITPRGTE